MLQAVKETEHSTRRILLVSNLADSTQITRTVVLMQLNTNQGPASVSNTVRLPQASEFGLNEMPDNLAGFLRFVKECEYFYKHEQRNAANPILVHCMNGVSRSAVFILVYTLIQIVDASCNDDQSLSKTSAISDSLIRTVKLMRLKRKYMIQSMYHLKYSYNAILYYLKDILFKEGVLTNSTFNNELNKVEIIANEFDSSILKDGSLLSIQSSNEGVLKEHQNVESLESTSVVATNQFLIEVSEKPKVNCSVIDLYDPNNFSLDLTADSAKRKQKITKKDFLNGSSRQVCQ